MTTTNGFEGTCSFLVSQLDMFRERWLILVKEMITDELAPLGTRIVNEALEESIDIGVQEEGTPNAFPFKAVNGKTVEAAIIGWQTQVAVGFALKKGYLDLADEQRFVQFDSALMTAAQNNPRWVTSFGFMFGRAPNSIDSFILALAHYLMNDPARSDAVSMVIGILENKGTPFLGALTHIATAAAFGDMATAEDLMAKVKPE